VFNLGFGELAVIFIVLIIAVGPDRLPAMMKGLGKTIRTVRQASRDIRATVGIDEMMREDVLQPLPRRTVPKAAIARPPSPAATLPAPDAATPTENARPAEAMVTEPAASNPAEATQTAAATPAPAPAAAPAPATPAATSSESAPESAAPTESAGDLAPRKD
jgi:sec-independent protein translocase protein TatB